MLKEIKFALFATKKNIKSSAELRTSFLMNVIGMAINNIASIILWVYFIKSVGVIGGWTVADIIGLQGFTALSYGVIFSIAMGIRKLPEYITNGVFDQFMLSPKNLLVRISTSSFNASALGDIFFGIVCMVVYGFLINVGLAQIIFILILIVLSTVVFFAIAVAISAIGFYFIDASTITDGTFQLFFTPALFHGGAFQGVIRFIFTFLVPSLLIGTLPVEAVKNLSFSKLALVGVLTFVWLFISIKLFNRSVRKYESSNFMTFGQ